MASSYAEALEEQAAAFGVDPKQAKKKAEEILANKDMFGNDGQ